MWKNSKSINKSTKQTANGKVRGHMLSSKGYTYVYDRRVLMHFKNIKDLDVAGFKIFEFNYRNKSTLNTT